MPRNEPTFKSTLQPVVDRFEVLVQEDPAYLLVPTHARPTVLNPKEDEHLPIGERMARYRHRLANPDHYYDPFADLAVNSTELLLSVAAQEIDLAHGALVHKDHPLYLRFQTARIGLGVVSLFSEIAPLKVLASAPEVPMSADDAARITTNSYEFIEKTIRNGDKIGSNIVRHYLQADEAGEHHALQFLGTLQDEKLIRRTRLNMFEVAPTDDQDIKVVGKDIDAAIDRWKAKIAHPRDLDIICPAETHADQQTKDPFTRRLFGILVEHTRKHIYPDYLPIARRAILAACR